MESRLVIDGAVLLLYFILIISIGLYMGRKEENLKDFALGGRAIPWWAVLASIIAAETSAGTFFGTPGEGFALRNYTRSEEPSCRERVSTTAASIAVEENRNEMISMRANGKLYAESSQPVTTARVTKTSK